MKKQLISQIEKVFSKIDDTRKTQMLTQLFGKPTDCQKINLHSMSVQDLEVIYNFSVQEFMFS